MLKGHVGVIGSHLPREKGGKGGGGGGGRGGGCMPHGEAGAHDVGKRGSKQMSPMQCIKGSSRDGRHLA